MILQENSELIAGASSCLSMMSLFSLDQGVTHHKGNTTELKSLFISSKGSAMIRAHAATEKAPLSAKLVKIPAANDRIHTTFGQE
jgi:hypothetical protein